MPSAEELRAEIEGLKAASVTNAAKAKDDLAKKSEQRLMANLRRERNILQGKAPDAEGDPPPAPKAPVVAKEGDK